MLWEKLVTVTHINNNPDYYHLYECLITSLRKSTFEIGLELLVFFTFINFFYKTIHLRA